MSPAAKNVATALMLHHNDDTGQCNPRQQTLADAVGIEREAVSRSVAALRGAGWITTTRRAGASEYVLRVEKGEPEAVAAAEMCAEPHNPPEPRCAPARTTDVTRRAQQMCASDHTEPSLLNPLSNPLSPPPSPAPGGRDVAKKDVQASGRMGWRAKSDAPLPADFALTAERRAVAAAEGVAGDDIERAFADFRDHAREKGRVCQDWDAAWSRWCRNRRKPPARPSQQSLGQRPPNYSRFQMPKDDPRARVSIPKAA